MFLGLLLAVGTLMSGWLMMAPVFAQSVSQIGVSLSLYDTSYKPIKNGKYEVRFAIYTKDRTDVDAYPSNGDARVWEETQTVEVKNGVLSATLGGSTSFPASLFSGTSDYYLGVRIGKDSEMTPRKKMSAVPFALNAQYLRGATIGEAEGDIPLLSKGGKFLKKYFSFGNGDGDLVAGNDSRLADIHSQNTDTGTSEDDFNIGSGTSLSGNNFTLSVSDGSSRPGLRYNGSTSEWEFSNDGSTYQTIGDIGNYVATITAGNGISGSSTTEGGTPTLSVNILSSTDGTGATSSASGLEFQGASNNELTLLQGCGNGQGISWNDTTNVWECTSFSAGLAGTGTAGYATYWSGVNALGSEQYLNVSRGGTGINGSAAANGSLLIGNGSGYTLGTLTAGSSALSITNGIGSITLDVDVTTTGTSTTTSSNSGLEVTASGLRIIGGCSNDQVLAWSTGTSTWVCSNKTGGTSDWTSTGALTYLTDPTDNFAIGGTTAISSRFYFDVATGNQIIFEGTGIDDASETILVVTNPTGDRTITLPDATGTIITTGNLTGITAVGTITSGIWNGTDIEVADGGTGASTFTSKGVLFGNGTSAIGATSAGTDGQILVGVTSNSPVFASMSGDVTITNAGLTTIGADTVALGTDTTGNYVATLTNGNGISGSASSEGATPTLSINLLTSADGTGVASSNSGLEFQGASNNQLTLLQGCANNEVLSWNDSTNVWNCSSVSGVGGITGSGTNGEVAFFNGASSLTSEAQLNVSRGGTGLNGSSAANGALLIGTGSGYSLSTLSSSGASVVITNGSGTINLESSLGTSVNLASAEVTGTLPSGNGGTGFSTYAAGDFIYASALNTLSKRTIGSSAQVLIVNGGLPVWTSLSGDVTTSDTGLTTIGADTVALGTDTTGNYVATLTNGNGISGSASSEGATPTLSINLLTSADGTGVASSNSGLEFQGASNNQLTLLQGCANNEVLSWNDSTNVWNCSSVSGVGGITGSGTNGEVAFFNGASSLTSEAQLNVSRGGTGLNGSSAANGALLIGTGSGYSLSTLSSSGASVVITNGSGTINLESSLGTSVNLASAEVTGTLPFGNGGTGFSTYAAGDFIYASALNTLSKRTIGSSAQVLIVNGGLPVWTSLSGDVTTSDTGLTTIGADTVALGTDTTGNYVASLTTSALTGLTGGTAGSEGAVLTLGFDYSATLAGNPALLADATVFGSTGIIFEGGTANGFEGLLTTVNPSADRTYTLPDATGTIITTGNLTGITAVGTITSGIWNGTDIEVADGGTGASTFTSKGVLFGNGTSAIGATSAGTDGQILVGVTSNSPVFASMSGDVTITNAGLTTIGADTVALGTDTTGNYVATLTNGNGIAGASSSEGATLTLSIDLLTAVDGTGATSSNSGLEFAGASSNELTLLQGCANQEVLSWNSGTSTWGCASISGVGGLSGSASSGQVAYWSGANSLAGENQLNVSRGGTGIDGSTATNGQILIGHDANNNFSLSTLTSGDGISITNGAGSITVTSSFGTSIDGSEITDSTINEVDLNLTNGATAGYILAYDGGGGFTWISNTGGSGSSKWTDSGSVTYLTATGNDVALGGTALGSSGFYFSVANGDITIEGSTVDTVETKLAFTDPQTSDKTITFPDATGTVITTGNLTGITATGTITSGTWQGGVVGVLYGGTGASSLNDLIALGTHTTGNYIATLSGNSQIAVSGSGSETAAVSLSLVADSIGDAQLAFNTGQNLTTVSSPTFAGVTVETATVTDDRIITSIAAGGAGRFDGTITNDDFTATRVYTLPDASGTFITTGNLTSISAVGANAVALGTDTTGNYVATLTNGNGISGSASSEGATPTLSINLLTSADGTGVASSNSGLEFQGASNNQLTLLQGCANNEVLSWNDSTNVWNCSSVSGVGGITGSGTNGEVAFFNGASSLTSEAQLNVSRGGTGLNGSSAANGALLIGTGSGYSLSTLSSSGASVVITNGSGTINLESSLGTSVNLASAEVTGTLPSGNGGTGFSTYAAGDFIYASALNTLSKRTIGSSAQVLIVNGGLPVWTSLSGDVTTSDTGLTTIGADTVALGTDTTGNYVATLTNGNGISGSASSEGATPTLSINLLTSADGTGVASSNSGLEFQGASNNQLTLLQGCANNEVLSWNDSTNVWNCSSVSGVGGITGSGTNGEVAFFNGASSLTSEAQLNVSRGGTGLNGSSAANGALLIGTGSGYSLSTLSSSGASVVITNGSGTINLESSLGTSVNLASAEVTGTLPSGNGGTGFSTYAAGDFIYASALNTLSKRTIGSSAQVLIVNGGLPVWTSLSGDVTTSDTGLTTIGADTVALGTDTTGNYVATLSGNSQIAVSGSGFETAAVSLSITADSIGDTQLAFNTGQHLTTASSPTFAGVTLTGFSGAVSASGGVLSAGTLSVLNGGTGATSLNDLIALGTHTTGNYVATIANGNGIAGASSSEGATLTLSVDILTTADGTGATSSNSGLEFQDTGLNKLTLLQGCADNQILSWNESTSVWGCSSVSGVGGVTGSGSTNQVTYWTGTSTLAGENQLNVSRGGTGINGSTAANGNILIGTGTGYALATLTQGAGMTITNGSGTITLATSLGASVDLTSEVTGTLPVGNGGTGATSLADLIALGTHTTGNYVLSIANGNGITGGAAGSEGGVLTLGIDILDSADGTSAVTSSFSGLEFQGTGSNELTLLQGCTDNQVLAWNEASSIWQCSDKTGGTSNWTDSGTITYLTDTTDSLALGGSTSTNARFFFDVATQNQIIFEGTGVDDANETTLVITNPTADQTITIQDNSGIVPLGTAGNALFFTTTGSTNVTLPTSGTIATLSNTLGDFAATTSLQLKNNISDETGSGLLVFATSPVLTTPNIGAATATSINGLTLTASTGVLTIANGKTFTASNTLTLEGTDGSTLNIGTGGTLGSAAYTASSAYEVPLTFSTGLTRSVNTVTVNTSQNIDTLSNLTTNGFVKTSGGTGALSIDTNTYLTGNQTITLSGDVTGSGATAITTTIAADAVALGTDTTGNYVSSATASGGLTLTGTEGASLGILLPSATDALSSTTSSGSGLELLASGLTLLQGCADSNVLSWNETTDAWGCASVSGVGGVTGTGTNGYNAYWTGTSSLGSEQYTSVSRGGSGAGTFTTNGVLYGNGASAFGVTAAGTDAQLLVANGSGIPTFVSMGTDATISNTGALTIANNAVALGTDTTGDYVSNITAGNGISSTGATTGETITHTLSLGVLTADWNQTGAFNISLNNVGAGLKILENGATPTLFGIFDVANLTTTDKTYTFPDASGTVALTSDLHSAVTVSGSYDYITLVGQDIVRGQVDLATDVSGILPLANGGTNATTIGSAGSVPYSTGTAYAFSAVGTSGQALISGGAGAPTWFAPTAGSILFAGTSGILEQDNANFFFDNSTNRLGLGTATPSTLLELYGSAADVVSTITAADATYDPILKFRTGATPAVQFSLGVDNTDSGKFKIYSGDGLGSGDEFTIDASGVTSIANLNLGATSFDTDAGAVVWVDMPVTSAAIAGTIERYTAQIDGNSLLTIYSESDGAGSIQNSGVSIGNSTLQTGARFAVTQTSTSTTAGTLYGSYNSISDTGIVTTGTDTTYGSYTSLTRTGATGGTINNYGEYITLTGDNAGAGTSTNTGLYVTTTGADTNYAAAFMGGNVGIGTATPTKNLHVYGNNASDDVYALIQNGSSSGGADTVLTLQTAGSNGDPFVQFYSVGSQYWSAGMDGASSNSFKIAPTSSLTGSSNFVITTGGNVGIGDATPDSMLTVGSGDLFQVNSSGAIAAATGITSSGTITFSGLSTAGIVTNTSGGVLGTTVSVPIANGGTNATTIGSAGSVPYSTGTAYAFSAVGTSGQALISGGAGAPTWFAPTAGSILFAGTSGILEQDNANFFFDNSTNRLGLGTATPGAMLDLYGASNAVRLSYDASNYNTISTSSTGDLSLASSNVSEAAIVIGTGSASQDVSVQYDSQTNDYFAGVDITTGNFMIGSGFTVQAASSFFNITSTGLVGINMTPVARFDITHTSTSTTGATEYSARNTFTDTGIVTTGTDTTYGNYTSLTRTGATGGTINNYGEYISLTGDTGGTSTNTGLYVNATGADTNYAAVFNGGNVGIGTSAPSRLLTVDTTSGGIANVITLRSPFSGQDTGTALLFESTGSVNYASISGARGATSAEGYLAFSTRGAVGFERMRIDTNGYVGIGTTAPSSLLSVYGAGADVVSTITAADATYDPILKFRTGATPAVQFSLGVDNTDSGKFKIYSGDGLGSGDEFTIDASGVTSIANLNLGATSFDTDAGAVTWIDMPVSSSASAGTIESYTAKIDENDLLTIYAESDGAGSIQNSAVGIGTTVPAAKLDIVQSSTSATASSTYYGLRTTMTDSGVVVSGTDRDYGTYTSLTRTGATTSGATSINTYGNYTTLSHTGAASGTVNAYGNYITATGDTGGTSTLYGSYISATGADTTYGLYANITGTTAATSYGIMTNLTDTTIDANTNYGSRLTLSDTGIVTTGTDTNYGNYMSLTRTGASGGTINNYGQYISLTGDTGGSSTNTGLYVSVAGADTNYAAVFANGYVGMGYATPTARLDIEGSNTTATIGSEMITNSTDRDFTGGIGNWTTGTNWAYGTNNAAHTAGTTGTLSLANGNLSAAPVSGNFYQITFTVNTTTVGTLQLSFGSVASATILGQSTGTITAETEVITAAGTGALTFTPDAAWAGTIDDVSVKLVTPSSATQIVRNSDDTIGLELRAGGTGLSNLFIGTNAGRLDTTGNLNLALGYGALSANTTGTQNIATGYNTLSRNTTGSRNVASGYNALASNTIGSYNVATGYQALSANISGDATAAYGYNSLQYNTTGSHNAAFGAYSLRDNTTGSDNTASGYGTLTVNISGSDNVAFGFDALNSSTTASSNTALGSNAVRFNQTGTNNTAVGTAAGQGVSTNSYSGNSLFGYRAGYVLTTGSSNILIGSQAGDAISSGSNNIMLGYNIDAPSPTGSNQLSIGNLIFGTGIDGTGTTVSTGNIGIGDASPSYRLEVNADVSTNYVSQFFNDGNNADRYGIQIQGGADDASGTTYYINALDGDGGQVGYIANTAGTFALTDVSDIRTKTNIVDTGMASATDVLNSLRVVDFNRLSNPDGPKITGFIAQEVEMVYPQAVTTGPTGLLGISKESFIPVLVKAFQEEDARLTVAETAISTIDLRTDANATTLGALQTSIDTQLTVAGDAITALQVAGEATDANQTTLRTDLDSVDARVAVLENDANTEALKVATLQSEVTTLKDQVTTLTDFYTALDLNNVIVKDLAGNVDLSGSQVTVGTLAADGLTITVTDVDAPTIGTAEILPIAVDADADGNDDYTDKPMTDADVMARDGKSVQVLTKAMIPMVGGSRIFTTFKGNPNGFNWVEKVKDSDGDFIGFKIRLSEAIITPIKVDWLLVEQK